jgi:hydroxyacylglutathione hydrolase
MRRVFSYLAHSSRMRPALTIRAIPLFADNYSWLIINEAHRCALLVDPADAQACLRALPPELELAGVLTTHHHADHSGGNAEIAAARAGVPIFCGEGEGGRVPAATRALRGGEAFEAGGVPFIALHTPCHTRGHVCYYVPSTGADSPPLVFTGDTLFSGGCGRFFEGDAAQMHASLAALLALPDDTRVFCGHEYTVANLRFCAAVEPGNAAVAARAAECAALRAAGAPTLPSTLAAERATNVFLRTGEAAVRAHLFPALPAGERAALRDVDVLHALREAKNAFK